VFWGPARASRMGADLLYIAGNLGLRNDSLLGRRFLGLSFPSQRVKRRHAGLETVREFCATLE